MVIVVLSGGIGNQLFQYATGYALAKKKKCKLLLDIAWFYVGNINATKPFSLEDLIELDENILIKNIWYSRSIRILFKILKILSFSKIEYRRIDIKNPIYWEKFPESTNYFINGYIQNIKYFNKHINKIINQFNIKKILHKKIRIGIHVRKGDQKNGPIDFCNREYYSRAINKIIHKKKLKLKEIQLVIFCEELEWPKKNIKNNKLDLKFVIGNDQSAIKDLKLMMNCDHLVISNSGYSWWAAAYISNKKENSIIVCPDLWWDRINVLNINIYLKNWIIVKTGIEENKKPEYLSS
jgi:hypothetical protein